MYVWFRKNSSAKDSSTSERSQQNASFIFLLESQRPYPYWAFFVFRIQHVKDRCERMVYLFLFSCSSPTCTQLTYQRTWCPSFIACFRPALRSGGGPAGWADVGVARAAGGERARPLRHDVQRRRPLQCGCRCELLLLTLTYSYNVAAGAVCSSQNSTLVSRSAKDFSFPSPLFRRIRSPIVVLRIFSTTSSGNWFSYHSRSAARVRVNCWIKLVRNSGPSSLPSTWSSASPPM